MRAVIILAVLAVASGSAEAQKRTTAQQAAIEAGVAVLKSGQTELVVNDSPVLARIVNGQPIHLYCRNLTIRVLSVARDCAPESGSNPGAARASL